MGMGPRVLVVFGVMSTRVVWSLVSVHVLTNPFSSDPSNLRNKWPMICQKGSDQKRMGFHSVRLLRQILCIKKNIGANLTPSQLFQTLHNLQESMLDLSQLDRPHWVLAFPKIQRSSGVNAVLARWIWLGVADPKRKKESKISNTNMYVVASKTKYNDIFLEFYVKNFLYSIEPAWDCFWN